MVEIKKKKKNTNKNKKIKVLILLLTVIVIVGLMGSYFLSNKTKSTNPSVDFGYEIEEEVIVKKVTPEPIEDVEIFAYDFKLASGQPENSVEISIPYDDKGLSEEEEIFSVCAKYFNEETKEWEDVYYVVDSKNNKVNILTDHFSTYAVFKIANPTKRSAYISEVNVYASYMTTAKAKKLLETYGNQETGWKEQVVQSTLDAFGSLDMFLVTSYPTLITLGGAYDSFVTIAFNDAISNLGIATACAQFAYDAYNNGLTSKETAISALKTTLSVAINFTTPSIQLAYLSVGFIDLALTDVSNFAVANKYRGTKNMYDAYYNRNENKRSIKDWTKIFEKIYNENINAPATALDLMSKEIDSYVNEYWEVAATDYDSWIDSYDKNGNTAKYPWPEKKHRENISNIHKENIYSLLQSTFRVMSRNMYLDSIEARQKEYDEVVKIYNKQFTVNIMESVKSGKKATWAGYYARFSPLSNTVESRSWTVKLDEEGFGKITFTLLGHQTAGFPMKIDLYKNGEDIESDTKTKTLNLKEFTTNTQTISLQSRKVEEPVEEEPIVKPSPEPTEEEPIVKPSPEPTEEDNPWYEITIKATDGSDAFSGWSAVFGYSNDLSRSALKDLYKSFNLKGECVLYIQEPDYKDLGSVSKIWLYQNSEDLLTGKKADLTVNYSLSGSRSGEKQGEPLYKSVVRVKPPEESNKLEAISGIYSSYMTYSLYIEEYELMGTPTEMRNEKSFSPYENPSANVTLNYNGESLSFMSSANPDQRFENITLLDKMSDTRYVKVNIVDGITYKVEVDIVSIGSSAKLTLSSERNSPKRVLKQEYMLNIKQ